MERIIAVAMKANKLEAILGAARKYGRETSKLGNSRELAKLAPRTAWVIAPIVLIIGVHVAYLIYAGLSLSAFREHAPSLTSLMRMRGDPPFPPERPELHLSDYPRLVPELIIAAEDSNFRRHFGIDLASIEFAARINLREGRVVYGGSTISQQLARTLLLSPARSYLRKYLEALAAIEAELLLGKDRILELYLECAEWGPGIYGFADAARHYYRKDVAELTKDEVVRLVSILPSPLRADPRRVHEDTLLSGRYEQTREAADFIESSVLTIPGFESTIEKVE